MTVAFCPTDVAHHALKELGTDEDTQYLVAQDLMIEFGIDLSQAAEVVQGMAAAIEEEGL